MRIVVVGATGNIGTALLRAAGASGAVTSIDAVSRRGPGSLAPPAGVAVRHHELDVAGRADSSGNRALAHLASGADAVVHLAWSWDRSPEVASAANAAISANVLRAARHARQVVVGSCATAYAPSYELTPRGEDWPVTGVAASSSSMDKVGLEQLTDRFATECPRVVVTRVRAATTLQESVGAALLRRQLTGRLPLPGRSRGIPVLVWPKGLRIQVAHADDVAATILAAVERRSPGAFNIASPQVLTGEDVAAAIGAGRLVEISREAASTAHRVARGMHLVRSGPGLLASLDAQPVLDTSRAADLLGVRASWSAADVVAAAARGIAARREGWTPALSRASEQRQHLDGA